MTDDDPGPTISKALGEIPQLLRGVIDKFLEVGHARMDLLTAEIRAEVEERLKRIILVIVPVCFILTALGLVNLGLVAWLSESMGPVAASFLLAGLYALIGVIWLLLWHASGGMNPKSPDSKPAQPKGETRDAPGAAHS